MKKNRKLRTRLVAVIITFTVLLTLCLGLIGHSTYYRGMQKEYQKYEETILNLAISGVDWDAVYNAVQKQKEDASTDALRSHLDYVKRSSKINWLYMLEPLNDSAVDNMRYISAGHTEEDYRQYGPTPLGKLTGTEYPQSEAKKYLHFFKTSAPGEVWYAQSNTDWGLTYTASRVVRTSDGKPIGVMGVDIYMQDIVRVLRIFPLVILFASLILSSLFILALSYWLNRRIVFPLFQLKTSAEQFVESSHGKSDPTKLVFELPDIHTGDEIEVLSDALLTMASDLKTFMKNLLHETAEKERIGTELNVATKIQAEMLPIIFPPFPHRPEIDIYASMTPAKEVGGDFYDFFMIDERHVAIVVADVSGKGVPAALFMVIGKTLIKDHTVPGVDPAEVFMKVNNMLCESNGEQLFITAFLGILDLVTGELKCVSAGHEPPYIYHDGKWTEHKIKKAFVLAGMEDMQYTTVTLQLEPGDKVFQYTDGVTEATDANEKLYGDERLDKALNRIGAAPARKLCEAVKTDIDQFVGAAPQFDDITMLCLEYKARMEA